MKVLVLLLLLVFGGIAAFAMLQREPDAMVLEPVETEAIVDGPKKPDAAQNRFSGPHDGSHIYQGLNCPACEMPPLEY